MGRKKNKHNKRRRQLFHAQSIQRQINNDTKYVQHKEFLDSIESKEVDELNRTIYVTNVKDLRVGSNLISLRSFFNQYGFVEKCITEHQKRNNSKRGIPPAGKITFKSAVSAEKIFGQPLDKVRMLSRDKVAKFIPSPVAYDGKKHPGLLKVNQQCLRSQKLSALVLIYSLYTSYLKVYPAERKSAKRVAVREESSQDILSETLTLSSISLGHWIPEDAGLYFLNEAHGEPFEEKGYEFLEESTGLFEGADVTFNLRRRVIQIQAECKLSVFDDLVSLIDELGLSYHVITFRLQDIPTFLDLGYDDVKDSYSLLFRCEKPPQIHKIYYNEGNDFENKTRLTEVHGAPFGHCFGIKISCRKDQFDKIFKMKNLNHNNFLQRLKDFGIMRAEVEGYDDAIRLQTTPINIIERDEIEKELSGISNKKIGRFYFSSFLRVMNEISYHEFCQ